MKKNAPRFLPLCTMIYLTLMLTVAVLSNNIIIIGQHITMAGTLFIPLWFVLSDIITEVYGYKEAQKIVWLAFFCHFIFSILCEIALLLPHPTFWHNESAYKIVLGPLLHNNVGSFIAYLISVSINIYLLDKWKKTFNGKYFWLRNIGASTIGELIFTALAVIMIQYHVLAFDKIIKIIITSYSIKVIGSLILALPASLIVCLLKNVESPPPNDEDLNPFKNKAIMKPVIILQNSKYIFDLDAAQLFNPEKYDLYLIVNDFCYNILNTKKQNVYYKKIFVTNDFSHDPIASLIKTIINGRTDFNIVTNTEETMPICGEMRKFFGLDTENYSRFYDKHIMKEKLAHAKHIHIPRYKLFDYKKFQSEKEKYLCGLCEELPFPIFVKPTCMYSSVNIRKIEDYTQLKDWAETLTGDIQYEIDEFIEGIMYHCDSFIKNSQVLFTFASQNSRPCYDFTIGKMKGTIVLPEIHPDAILLSDIAEKTLHELGIPKAGVTHLEIIKTKENKIYFIEIAHRPPGCLIPKMYQSHANVDIGKSNILLQIDPEFHPKPIRRVFTAWACYPKIPGIVSKLKKLPPNIKSHCEINWCVKTSDVISGYSTMGRDYTGTIFMVNKKFDLLFKEFFQVNELNLCEILAF